MAKISIIVPVYNVEQYLEKCIESILNQTLEDIEIILIDDGATDNSSQMCDDYALRDNRIKVIHKTNGGLSDARNAGLEIATGKYIAFLDSDDWVESNTYEYLYSIIQRENADIVQCDYIEAYNEDTKITFNGNIRECVYTGIEALQLLSCEGWVKTVVVWNKLYRKEVFDPIRFPKGKVHEDEFTTYKVLHKANKVINSNLPLIYYRQREGSIMNEEFNEKRLHKLEAWKEKRDYFEQHNLKDLAQQTEYMMCGCLKDFYLKTQTSELVNKQQILKQLKNNMKKDYIKYIKNPCITNRGKISLTICLLNRKVFLKMYGSYTDKNSRR